MSYEEFISIIQNLPMYKCSHECFQLIPHQFFFCSAMFDDILSSSEDEEDKGGNATFLDACMRMWVMNFCSPKAQRVQNVLDEEFYEWDDVWNEEPFNECEDDLTKANPMLEGVPQCCADMSSKFQRGDEPLFDGSKHKGKDLARFVLGLKCKHFKMGDTAIAGNMGMLASFLSEGM